MSSEEIKRLDALRQELADQMTSLFQEYEEDCGTYVFKHTTLDKIGRKLGYHKTEISRFLSPITNDSNQPKAGSYRTIIRVVKAVDKADKQNEKRIKSLENRVKKGTVIAEKLLAKEEEFKQLKEKKDPLFKDNEINRKLYSIFVYSGLPSIACIFLLWCISMYYQPLIVETWNEIRTMVSDPDTKVIISKEDGLIVVPIDSTFSRHEGAKKVEVTDSGIYIIDLDTSRVRVTQ